MVCKGLLAFAVGLVLAAAAPAQTAAWQLRSRPGQVLRYRVEQVTSATEVIGGTTTGTTTKLSLVKDWKNLGPEGGKAGDKFVLSLAALRLETTRAGGETLRFDSANPDKSTPEMREQL